MAQPRPPLDLLDGGLDRLRLCRQLWLRARVVAALELTAQVMEIVWVWLWVQRRVDLALGGDGDDGIAVAKQVVLELHMLDAPCTPSSSSQDQGASHQGDNTQISSSHRAVVSRQGAAGNCCRHGHGQGDGCSCRRLHTRGAAHCGRSPPSTPQPSGRPH